MKGEEEGEEAGKEKEEEGEEEEENAVTSDRQTQDPIFGRDKRVSGGVMQQHADSR